MLMVRNMLFVVALVAVLSLWGCNVADSASVGPTEKNSGTTTASTNAATVVRAEGQFNWIDCDGEWVHGTLETQSIRHWNGSKGFVHYTMKGRGYSDEAKYEIKDNGTFSFTQSECEATEVIKSRFLVIKQGTGKQYWVNYTASIRSNWCTGELEIHVTTESDCK
jgi:hypothetical protein